MSRRLSFFTKENFVPHSLKRTRCWQLQGTQVTAIFPARSDHAGILVDLGQQRQVFNGNVMKLCNHANNGFGKTENQASYQARIVATTLEDCETLRKNPGIIAITRQEFAILPEDIALIKQTMRDQNIPGWENPVFYISEFGVMTCFKNGEIANAFHPDENFTAQLDPALQSRIQKFSTSERYALFNLHTPLTHAEKQFEKMIRAIVENKIAGIENQEFRCVDIIGDKNLNPADQIRITRKVIEKINHKRIQAKQKPIAVLSCLVSSPDGHQKQDQHGEVFFENVDSAHRLIMALSDTPQFEHIHEAIENAKGYSRWKYIFSAMFGGAFITGNAAVDDATLELAFTYCLNSVAQGYFQHQQLGLSAS